MSLIRVAHHASFLCVMIALIVVLMTDMVFMPMSTIGHAERMRRG